MSQLCVVVLDEEGLQNLMVSGTPEDLCKLSALLEAVPTVETVISPDRPWARDVLGLPVDYRTQSYV